MPGCLPLRLSTMTGMPAQVASLAHSSISYTSSKGGIWKYFLD